MGSAHGVKGWCHVHSFTDQPGSIVDYPNWMIERQTGWQRVKIDAKRVQENKVVVKFIGIDDRDAAQELRGCDIGILKTELPVLSEDEYYWADLIGLVVFTSNGTRLGVIAKMLETGANDVMVVQDKQTSHESTEYLIPYLKTVILEVNLLDGKMIVDWDVDY